MRVPLAALLVLALAGDRTVGEESPRTPPERTREAVLTGHALPREIIVGVMLSRNTLVHAVYGATALSGGGKAVQTGTLTPTAGGLYRYSPEPADRLVVGIGGQTHEFVVKHVEGNMLAPTPAEFITASHVLEYAHAIPGKMQGTIKISTKDAKVAMDAKGSYELNDRTFEVDLRARGTVASTADLVGETTTTTFDVHGTVRSEALSMLLTVKERHEIAVLESKTRIPNRFQPVGAGKRMAKSLTKTTDVLDSTLRLGEDTYRWIDCSMRKTIWANRTANWPGDFHDWTASGTVMRNDQPYGTYDVLREGAGPDPNVCRFVLKSIEGTMNLEVKRR